MPTGHETALHKALIIIYIYFYIYTVFSLSLLIPSPAYFVMYIKDFFIHFSWILLRTTWAPNVMRGSWENHWTNWRRSNQWGSFACATKDCLYFSLPLEQIRKMQEKTSKVFLLRVKMWIFTVLYRVQDICFWLIAFNK
jgi:hypothetical protein